MKVLETTLKDCWLIKPEVKYDFRGEFLKTFDEKEFNRQFSWFKPVEHDISTSKKGVLRGIHYSPNCWKLNQCLYGEIYYVVVNCEEGHPEFGKWEAFILSGTNRHQIFKHPRYATGFLVLSEFALFHYIQDQYFDAENPDQQSFKWDDPELGIWWPVQGEPILSRRDRIGKYI